MIKFFKLILAVALATLVGIWASKYHGYIMLVLADKNINMSVVAFVFIPVSVVFLLIRGGR
ncbi:heme biosynthesis protein HemY, partial [Francisella tularensis subsp. holarctica]|nr:heme biosynthesis protein HemY [Francisella tularensis subsp. holarctica]